MEKLPLRVLFYMFFPGGGIGRYTHEVAEAMHEIPDVDVEVACLKEYEFLSEARYKTWPSLFRIHSDVAWRRRLRFLIAQFISPRRALKHAAATKADVIHFSNINHLSYALWNQIRKRNPKLKVVATAHDVRRSKSILNRAWEESSLRKFYEQADALFIHSPQQREDLLSFAKVKPENIHQVPMGTMPYAEPTLDRETLRKQFGIPLDRKVGLFFGNIRDDKNLDTLLEAMSQLDQRIFLVIAGRAGGIGNKNEQYYREMIQRLGLEEDILFLHRFIDDKEVGNLFSLADFVPLCYRTSFTSQSAVLNVAMHYERPVIATPAPTLAATIENLNLGVVAATDQQADITRALDSLLKSISAPTPPKFEFSEYKRRNSWQENARITARTYHQICH